MNLILISRTKEYNGKFLIWYFVDPLLALITSKIRLGILSTSFWSWTEGIFPMRLRSHFWVQKLLISVGLLHKVLQQSITTNFLFDRGRESTLGGQEVIFFIQSSTSLLHIFVFKKRNYIVNLITMTRKSGEHLRTIYGKTGQLFGPY